MSGAFEDGADAAVAFGPLTGWGTEALLALKTVPSKPFNDIHVPTDLAAAWRTPDESGCLAVPLSCQMAALLGHVCPAGGDIRLNTWIHTALRELPFGFLCREAAPILACQPSFRFA